MRALKVLSLRGSSSKKEKESESPPKEKKQDSKKEPVEPKSPKSPKSPLIDPIKVIESPPDSSAERVPSSQAEDDRSKAGEEAKQESSRKDPPAVRISSTVEEFSTFDSSAEVNEEIAAKTDTTLNQEVTAKSTARRVSASGAIREIKKISTKLPWAVNTKAETLPPFLQQKMAPPPSPINNPNSASGPQKKATSPLVKANVEIETQSQKQEFAKLKQTTPKIGGSNANARESVSAGVGSEEKRERTRSQGKYLSTAATFSLSGHLSEAEHAFMPGDLIKRLGSSAGQLPPAPSSFAGTGAVLFVDVSGFTKLGEKLMAENVPVKAALKLANIITKVLKELATACLDNGGEIGKFAGDALLCVWDSKDMEKAEKLARQAGYDMLLAMEHLNRIEGTELKIHGGVAKGSLLHIHLGSENDELRWYLIAGEAVAAATMLVDVANPGEFCCQEGVAQGLPNIMLVEEDDEEPAQVLKGVEKLAIMKNKKNDDDGQDDDGMFASMRGKKKGKEEQKKEENRKSKSLARGKKLIKTSLITNQTKLPPPPSFAAEHEMIEALIADGLPSECNVYIPTALRGRLEEKEKKGGEMRRRIAIIFVELEHLRMSEEELVKQHVQDGKLDALNDAFVTMTRLTHAFEGEVRDMLFDDKGCIFIAMFGAHNEEEREDNRWNLLATKTAIAIVNEIPNARVGVSCGHCFVGIAGVSRRRTDFVVIGHEVNMAARYMAIATPGQVIVSSGIAGTTKDAFKYDKEFEVKVGKGDKGKMKTVFTPLPENSKRASFLNFYKKHLEVVRFVGRGNEMTLVEQTIMKISQGRSGVIAIEGPPGRGKSTLVKNIKKMGRGKIEVVSGSCLSHERNSPYFSFRQIVESFTGIRPAMTQQEARSVVEKLESKGERLNIAALAQILPWIGDAARPGDTVAAVGGGTGPDQICDTILKILNTKRLEMSEQATMFVIEDLQWMDMLSLELLVKLLDGTDKVNKFAILITIRLEKDDGEIAFGGITDSNNVEIPLNTPIVSGRKSTPSTNALLNYSEQERIELVRAVRAKIKKFKFNSCYVILQPLQRKDAEALCASLMGAELNLVSAQKMWDVSKGEPFFLEMFCAWLQMKKFVQSEKSGSLTITCDASQIPKTTTDLIVARLNNLPPDVLKILGLGVSGGETFDAMYVNVLSKQLANENKGKSYAVDEVITLLNEALDFLLIGSVEGNRDKGFTRFRFKHDLYCRAIWKTTVDASLKSVIDKIAAEERKKLTMRLKLGQGSTE